MIARSCGIKKKLQQFKMSNFGNGCHEIPLKHVKSCHVLKPAYLLHILRGLPLNIQQKLFKEVQDELFQ